MEFVVDKSAQRLIDQVLQETDVARSDIGTIAGPNHRQSGPHFPEDPPPPGNPPHQVDAVDFPHQPEKGLDCNIFTEELRLSRDQRLYLVIWNRHQFSSYAHGDHAPFTWRPYTGTDPHDTHCHVEVNDVHHDETQDWKVFAMADMWDKVYKVLDDADDGKVDGIREGDTTGHTLMLIRSRTFQLLAKLDELKTPEIALTDAQADLIADKVVEKLAGKIIFVPQARQV